jgi:hypothetical protein
MGDLAALYRKHQVSNPNEALTRTLEAWSTGGLAAVEKLVKQGLAPAVALTVLGAYSQNEERVPGS